MQHYICINPYTLEIVCVKCNQEIFDFEQYFFFKLKKNKKFKISNNHKKI